MSIDAIKQSLSTRLIDCVESIHLKMKFVCILVKIFKIKEHSMTTIFFTAHKYSVDYLTVVVPGGLNDTFS